MAPAGVPGTSLTPTTSHGFSQPQSMSIEQSGSQLDQEALRPPSRFGRDNRSMSNPNASYASKVATSVASSGLPPGSFSPALKLGQQPRSGTPKLDLGSRAGEEDQDESTTSEQRQAGIREQINKETKIKVGSENLLDALNIKSAKQTKEQRSRVESELNSANRRIAQLKLQLQQEILRSESLASQPTGRLSGLFQTAAPRSPSKASQITGDVENSDENETESPTYVLAEILQALENEGMQPDYYVERANNLVDLFKRYPTLKYDLAWSVFGLRMQTMLLSESREVVAAGYRLVRYAITDRDSLRKIRSLHTDELVILSLIKESKASVEREQALKFVRAFLDVKGGVQELSCGIIRTIVAIAEHHEDRLRNISILTLTEILLRAPALLVSAGGLGPLTDAIGDGTFDASDGLVTAFIRLLDMPCTRIYLRPGHELEVAFASFTDPFSVEGIENRLRANAKVIASMLKTWPGLMTLCMYDFTAIRSLLSSLHIPSTEVRDIILELLFDILRIKTPSWSSSFLAGRRLTTYGRVANLDSESSLNESIASTTEPNGDRSLVEHVTALILGVLVECGLVEALLNVLSDITHPPLKRKTTLLLGQVLKLASVLLPNETSARLQVLPELFSSASKFGQESRAIASGTLYQVDSVNRTLHRSGPAPKILGNRATNVDEQPHTQESERSKQKMSAQMDESQFRSYLLETQVLNTVNFTKWKWDIIQDIVEGPLLNPKRLDEAIKATKFVKRLIGFYRPFKYRFSNVKNTKPNQRYVRIGCKFLQTLLQNVEGIKYLAENKLLRQVAECLAQLDRASGLTSLSPLFSPSRLTETLSGGYFALLGTLSSDPKGLQMLERWHVINMFYHIVELDDRDDLIEKLLLNMDYSLDSHLRVILSKALTTCSKDIRIVATRILHKYANGNLLSSDTINKGTGTTEWAIRLLVTQLYDPEVEVCEVAVRILEEACDGKFALEYVVKCRPALDHLGPIGAPLLLRFLSTSVGYHYLDGLDYITQEMDDWFLGRNDNYVTLVEASLTRGLDEPLARIHRDSIDNETRPARGLVPPHFYRELTRTAEGCKLLREKGHFEEFVSTIQEFGMEKDDPEIILKVKGCLWAVGNVGSMELGAPFLEESGVVEWIVKIAETSEIMTMRGTAFFVLGLISRSLHGSEILLEYGWDSATTSIGESLGYCVPLDLKKLFSIKPWNCAPQTSVDMERSNKMLQAVQDTDPINKKILQLVVDLGNTVLTKRAANELHRIKAKKPVGFEQSELFRKVMIILECHHFRLPIRRFVVDLFDKGVMRRIVLEEYESEPEVDGQNDEDGTS